MVCTSSCFAKAIVLSIVSRVSPGRPIMKSPWIGLLKGKTVGIDGTTLEANAAMRSIVRRDTGEGYEEFLRRLAEESGIATPTREQLAKLDRLLNQGFLITSQRYSSYS